jgi:NTP pyrophosphatase (non-canonical NTP hydrolase)
MSDINEIINALVQFRDEREWEQYHDSKNLASALAIEAAEVNELYLWKSVEESEKIDKGPLADEIADVLAYTFMLAHRNNLDIKEIVLNKIKKNAQKYPVEKAKGSSKKYTDLK